MEFTPMIILAQKGSKIYPNTTLPITLWLKCDNKKIIYMQNNYNKYTTGNDLIPISIDKDNPRLLENVILNVKEKDLKKVFSFIKEKYQALIDMVNGVDMDYSIMEYTYINRFKPTVVDGFFVNEISPRNYPSLPVYLYLYCDNIDYDDGRNPYTLLMSNKVGCKVGFEHCVTVSIDKENPQLVYDVKLGITQEEFKRVQDFIRRHYDFLVDYTKSNDMDIGDIADRIGPWEENPLCVETIDEYCVVINTGDYEPYPHFHFMDIRTLGKKFDACIKIGKPEYLNHSLSRNDKLNEKQKKDLQKLLEEPFRNKLFHGTAYEYITFHWNNNNDKQVDGNLPIPDYRKLK